MGNLFANGATYLASQVRALGLPITYRRGTQTVSAQAVPCAPRAVSDEAGGLRIESDRLDFVIDPSQLVIGGQLIEPVQGDTIRHSGNDYRVVAPDRGKPPWQLNDGNGKTIRVFASKIS